MSSDQTEAPRRRARRKDARPSEILQAAMTLFAERGFAATRLEDVARAAGIGKGTIYLYFATKQDLFEAVVRQELVPRLDAADKLIAGFQGSSADLLRMMAGFAVEAIESDLTQIPKLVMTESGNFPELAKFYADTVVRGAMQVFEIVLARGIARGEFRAAPVEAMMPVIVGPVLMMALWKHSLGLHSDIRFSPVQVMLTHVDLLLHGLCVEPKS